MSHYYNRYGSPVPRVSNVLSMINIPGTPSLTGWHASMSYDKACEILDRDGKLLRGGVKDRKVSPSGSVNRHKRECIDHPKAFATWAADIGTQSHSMFEAYIKKEDVQTTVPDACLKSYEMFKNWIKIYGDDITDRVSEKSIVADNYGGTVDLACCYIGAPCVGDFKTSGQINEGYYMQLAAYANLLKIETGEKKISGFVGRFCRYGTAYEMREISWYTLDAYYDLFRRALDLYLEFNWMGHEEQNED